MKGRFGPDAWRRRRNSPGRGAADDAGITLIEMLVAMGLMGVFMAMFTGAVIQIHETVNRTEAIGTAQEQVTRVVARLDKEIRYASEISAPGTESGFTYVEFLSTHSGTSRCTQLRLVPTGDPEDRQLRMRDWESGAANSAIPAWSDASVLASYVTALSFPAPEGTSAFQRLQVKLTVESPGDGLTSSKDTDVTFTALNSSSGSANTSIAACVDKRGVNP